jgi:hypothetical protein
MKSISIFPMIALFGVVAVSAAPVSHNIDQNACEYFGMPKYWCVDGKLDPELFAHLGDSSVNRHAPGTKRDDFQGSYDWPKDFMALHDMTEFEKRSDKPKQVPKEVEARAGPGPSTGAWGW